MAKKKNLSIEQRAAVVTLSKEEYSGRAIAKAENQSVCCAGHLEKGTGNRNSQG